MGPIVLGVACGGQVNDPNNLDSPCDLAKPFGPRVRLDGLVAPDNGLPACQISLTPNELTAYFGTDSETGLYVAHRASLTDPFVTKGPFGGAEGQVTISTDELTMYWYITRSTPHLLNWSTRSSSNDPFVPLVPACLQAPTLTNNFHGDHPFLTADQQHLYYGCVLPSPSICETAWTNGAGCDTRSSSSSCWGAEHLILSEADSPVVSTDGLTMYYEVYESYAVSVTTRTDASQPFSPGVPVPELHGLAPQWLSPDGCRLYGKDSTNTYYVARRGR